MCKRTNTIAILGFVIISLLFMVACNKLHSIDKTDIIIHFEERIESTKHVRSVSISDNYKPHSTNEVTGFIVIEIESLNDPQEQRHFLICSVLKEIAINEELRRDLCNGLIDYNIQLINEDGEIVQESVTSYFTYDDARNSYKQDSSVECLTQWRLSEIPGDPSEGLYSDKYSAVIYLSDEGYELRDRKTNNLIESKKWDEVSS